jgi:ATP-dependent Clp protease ATP-binding subunit ClpC
MSSELPAAEEEARALAHHWLGGEHLLLALARGPGVASEALASLGVAYERLRARVVQVEGEGEEAPPQVIPLTPRARRVLDLAERESQELGDADVRPEHVLLALVEEGEGLAVRLLQERGADPARVQAALFQRRSEWSRSAAGATPEPRARRRAPAPVVAGAVVAGLAVGWVLWTGSRRL